MKLPKESFTQRWYRRNIKADFRNGEAIFVSWTDDDITTDTYRRYSKWQQNMMKYGVGALIVMFSLITALTAGMTFLPWSGKKSIHTVMFAGLTVVLLLLSISYIAIFRWILHQKRPRR